MGGRVGFESHAGRGATFWLELPATAGPGSTVASAPAQPMAGMPAGLSVLLALRHPATRRAVAGLFAHLGAEVTDFAAGDEVLGWLDDAGAKHGIPARSIVCLDSDPPGGIAAWAHALRQRGGPELRVIVLAPLTSTDLAVDPRSADGTLFKPVTRSAVLSLVARLYGQVPRAVAQRADAPVARRFHAHVLLAEDNQVNREIATAMLHAMDCKVTQAHDGAQALTAVLAQPIDLVLMDCQMPVMDGFESTRRIRAWEQSQAGRIRVPIVALTANALAGDREACLGAGMDDYMAKPISSARMAETLARHLGGSSTQTPQARPPMSPPRETPVIADAAARTLVYDPSLLESLPMVADGSQPGFPAEMRQLFATSNRRALADVDAALAAGDTLLLLRLLHTMKSSSGQIGALELSALARDCEHALRAGERAEPGWSAQLHAAFVRLDTAWKALPGAASIAAP
jgi:CheY-like chemotaxis protein/HPt (histidine-containing phosphotransfer) domain-containing protein